MAPKIVTAAGKVVTAVGKAIMAGVRGIDWACRQPLLAMVVIYQKTLAPLFYGHCRFVPSCSEYAKIVLVRFSFFRALRLIICRLARCHPFCKGGEDPPPPH